ncbi:hypothetical protein [Ottowia sp. VDI28]|uniref:hypothetical protein n=1 Tax=Ottowia sp. VDI28 TaxID=3133968 RepID=UPI003C2F58D4
MPQRGVIFSAVLGAMTWASGSAASAQTVNYTTPGVYSYTVPAGVQALDVDLAGGGGGSGTGVNIQIGIQGFDGLFPGGSGGDGARLTARVAVVPGNVISITVAAGGGGGEDDQNAATPLNGGAGGAGAGSGGRSADGTKRDEPEPITSVYTAGGGGGASAVQMAGNFYLRAGGGGGGSSATYGQSSRDLGISGQSAPLAMANTPDCGTPANGGDGLAPTDVYTGGGSTIGTGAGGGGGYLNNAGAGGASAAGTVPDGTNWWTVNATPPTSATGGGSCYYTASVAYAISNPLVAVGAPGAIVDPGTLPLSPGTDGPLVALNGADGWVRITPVQGSVTPAVTSVPTMGTGSLALLTLALAGVGALSSRAKRRR